MSTLNLRATSLLATTLFLVPAIATAAFSPAELVDATELAISMFETDQAAHEEGFVGYKAWKSGEDARVKIYVSHDGVNMEFDYLCEMHPEGLDCHEQ